MNRHPAPARSLAAPRALLLAVSLALVGCSNGTDDAPEEGPITARLNALSGGGIDIDQRSADDARYGEIVAACMKEEGFMYTPVPLDKDAFAAELSNADSWDVVADAKENGYQITPVSKDALIEQYGLGQVSDDATAAPDPSPDTDDPNIAYYRNLSAGDQAAYEEAMYGAPEDQVEGYDWTATGCVGEAYHEVYEAQEEAKHALLDSTVIEDFHAYVDDQVTDDPRMAEAEAAWASCMADKGYGFADRDEAPASIQQQFDDLTGIDDGSEPDLDRFSDAEITALHEDEIATATADAQCYASSDIDGVRTQVELDAEIEFYNTHKTEVDAWLAAQDTKD